MGLRMKNFNILGVRWKILFLAKNLGERSRKTKIGGGIAQKRKLGQFADSRGVDKKEGGGVFERGLIPQCTLCFFQLQICSFPLPHKEKEPKNSQVSLLPLNSNFHLVTQQKLHVQLQSLLLCYFCFTFILSVLNLIDV